MIITNVRFIGLQQPLETPLQFAWGSMAVRNFGLILVDTDEGLQGIGETSVNFPSWALEERRATVEYGLRPLLIGEDPRATERLWTKMYDALGKLRLLWGKGAIMSAIGGVDIALWDLAGKAADLPVWRMLGGTAHPIRLYATGLSTTDLDASVQRCIRSGYTALKVRVGFDAEADLRTVRAVREAAGPAVDLLIDANMAWDRSQAAAMIEQLAAYEPYWIEEPLPADDVAGLAALLATSRVRIAAGENAFGCDDVRTLLTKRAVSVLMPDPTRAGGITEVRRMCALAAAWGIPYSPHHYGSDVGFAAALHLMAATPGGALMLRDVSPAPLREMILAEPLVVHDGYARVPDGPGLGIRLDMDVVQAYSVDTK